MELKIIKTEAVYRAYLGAVERLALADPSPDSAEGTRLEVLALLVEEYEKARFKFETPSPIEAIQFRMHEQGLRQADLVPYFGSRSRASEVLAGKRPLTVQMIRELSAGLGISANVLVADSTQAESEPLLGSSDVDWDRLPSKEMERHGYFSDVPKKSGRSLSELARDFVTSILPKGESFPVLARRGLRGDAVTPKSRYGLLAWKARVLHVARKRRASLHLPSYSPDAINPAFLTQVVHLSWHKNGMRLARELIEGKGVPVVIEPHLAGTQLDGAAFVDQDGTPVIGLTLRFDRVDHFWFTLLHELAHVAKHLSNPGDAFLDRLEDSDATEALEIEANRIARDALIPRPAWRRSEVVSAPSRERILEFAGEQMIHPAIVAGRVRRESGNFRAFGELLGKNEVRSQFPEISFE
jgi:HTH-type transcriptional regulator / antitoxin HigA